MACCTCSSFIPVLPEQSCQQQSQTEPQQMGNHEKYCGITIQLGVIRKNLQTLGKKFVV